jgi:hypothetical protein
MSEIFNQWLVSVRGDGLIIVGILPIAPLTPQEAMTLAAWLVACSMKSREEFLKLLDEVLNS